MSKKTLIVVGIIFLFSVAAALWKIMSAPTATTFVVQNLDSIPIDVTARWDNSSYELGTIAPAHSAEFTAKTSAMTFAIVRNNGTGVTATANDLSTQPLVHIDIDRTSVAIKYAQR